MNRYSQHGLARILYFMAAVWLTVAFAAHVSAESRYYAARYSVTPPQTWGICERDGANRPTDKYLSSLLNGELQTGAISSPPFRLSVDRVNFTMRGHDGRGGGRGRNYAALTDDKTGETLRKTLAPGNDALRPVEWDVAQLKGRTVRFQLVDGISDGAYAWLGVENLDAGPELKVDFRRGLPEDWDAAFAAEPSDNAGESTDVVDGPVPFRVFRDAFTWVPDRGVGRVSVESHVERLFLLGCTVPGRRLLETYGFVDLVYDDGETDAIPLVYGFTLENPYKTFTKYRSAHLLPIGDGTQYIVAISPKPAKLARIELRRVSPDLPRPRISAITCQLGSSQEASDALLPLESVKPATSDEAWLVAHAVSATMPNWLALADEIRRDHGVPTTLKGVQRLEEPGRAFVRRRIADQPFEAASVCDLNGDGRKDIVSGDYWYAGPGFAQAIQFRTLDVQRGYRDSFHDYPMDVNGDGRVDIVSGGWFGKTLAWWENPGEGSKSGEWPRHEIAQTGPVETTRFWDVDGDGYVEVAPNAGGNVVFYRLARDRQGKGTGEFTEHVVKSGGCGHGLGFGDINGDGRGDFVIPNGWLEAPANPLQGEWILHNGFALQRASVPILVHDVNEDGLADIVYGNGHGYGLFWVEQQKDEAGERTWAEHTIDDQSSQCHDVQLADIDGDGRLELVTGKRYYAHNGKDAGAEDPVFVRYYDFDRRGVFTPHTIDFGAAGEASGVGIYFWIEDVTGNGRLDIVAPGKEGLFLFTNQ